MAYGRKNNADMPLIAFGSFAARLIVFLVIYLIGQMFRFSAEACGGSCLRWTAPKPRKVLYVDGEMPARTMQERVAAFIAAADKEPPSPDCLPIMTPDLQAEPMPNLATPSGQQAVEEWLADDVELLVLDNVATLCRHGKENETESWGPVQGWLLDLRRRGLSVLLVHHAGKGGQQRGTSSREDVLDTVISLRRPADYQPSEGARFEVHLEVDRHSHRRRFRTYRHRLQINR